ncbi:hypothetical protein DM02DRAFT_648183 [Periconia macrospinosa]|uniref:Uncharacterized protein n=1 Tax=Periconia macrospinosa TaxID=97972 RepID=A0A2V1EBY2_9PLEO|nr:hypothetical protein DM02DRAFT_648183 [Periconia macrospinosa]
MPTVIGGYSELVLLVFAGRELLVTLAAIELKTKFAPSTLAYRVAEDIAPYLNPIAIKRGVRVRASFSLGSKEESTPVNNIFNLDVRIRAHGKVLKFVGPREESEKGRFWEKLEARRWF